LHGRMMEDKGPQRCDNKLRGKKARDSASAWGAPATAYRVVGFVGVSSEYRVRRSLEQAFLEGFGDGAAARLDFKLGIDVTEVMVDRVKAHAQG